MVDQGSGVSPFEAYGITQCISRATRAAHHAMVTMFEGMYRGSLQGNLRNRLLIRELIRAASHYGWDVTVLTYFGNEADPDSRASAYPLIRLKSGVGVVVINSTRRAVPRSRLQAEGLTTFSGSDQALIFEVPELLEAVGWAIPPGIEKVLFVRYAIDTRKPEQDVAYGFDLVELEAGGRAIRSYLIRDLGAYASGAEAEAFDRMEPEPAMSARVHIDPKDVRSLEVEAGIDEEPVVTWRDDAGDENLS